MKLYSLSDNLVIMIAAIAADKPRTVRAMHTEQQQHSFDHRNERSLNMV